MEVGIDPRVGALQPDRPVALVAPRGGAGGGELVGVVAGEKFGRGDHRKGFLVVSGFAKEIIEEDGALVPPVAVQFGVVGAEDDGFGSHHTPKMLDLFFAIEHKVGRVVGGTLSSEVGSVRLFVRRATGDAVVLEASELSHAVGLDVGADVVVIQVEATISIKVAVLSVPGVALLRAPHLFTGFDIASEGGGSSGGEDGGKNPVGGAGFGIEDSVGINNEPANLGLLKMVLDPWVVGAFGQPDATGVATKTVVVVLSGDLDLSANGLRKLSQKGQKTVGGSAGDNFQDSGILEFAEGLNEVALVTVAEEMAAVVKTIVIKAGERLKGGVVSGAVQLLVREFNLFFESVDVAILEKRIAQHGAERWGHRHGEAEVDSVADQALHHIEERKIGFGDGFVEPVLFEELGVLGMSDEGEVGVEDGSYITEGHEFRWSEVDCREKCRAVGWSRVWGRYRSGVGEFRSSPKIRIGDISKDLRRGRRRSWPWKVSRSSDGGRKEREGDGRFSVGEQGFGPRLPPGGETRGQDPRVAERRSGRGW